MQIVPLNKKVLLKPIKDPSKETKTTGGIYLPEKDSFGPHNGEVVAIGDKVELKIKKGDKVIYEDIGADKVEDHIIIDESRIIALVK